MFKCAGKFCKYVGKCVNMYVSLINMQGSGVNMKANV